MEVQYLNYKTLAVLLAVALVSFPAQTLAQSRQCPDHLFSEWKRIKDNFQAIEDKFNTLTGAQRLVAICKFERDIEAALQAQHRIISSAEGIKCSYFASCDTACFASKLEEARTKIREVCAPSFVENTKTCAAAIDRYSQAHRPFIEKNTAYVKNAVRLEFDLKDAKGGKAASCEHLKWAWTVYHPFIRSETRKMEEACGEKLFYFFNKGNYKGSQYFTYTQPDITRAALQEACGVSADSLLPFNPAQAAAEVKRLDPSTTRPSASCGSTITGGNLPPAPRERCDSAKKLLKDARATRKSWFGSKSKAEQLYKNSADGYREVGDLNRARLVLEESKADDVTVYEQADVDAEQRPQNLKEAENLRNIARKIELGAYESKSCGDLLKAADYYFQSARFFLKANEFKATDTLLLRRDQLVAIVDDAKERGACDVRVSASRSPALPPVNETPQADLRYCQRMAEFFSRKENQNTTEMAVYKLEVAQLCKGVVSLTEGECLRAKVHWYEILDTPEIKNKLALANCRIEQNS